LVLVWPFGRKCKKLVKYQNRNLEFSSKAGVGLAGTTVELSNFKTGIQQLEQASELAKVTDEFYYRMCELYKNVKENTPEYAKYLSIQTGALKLLTGLEASLITFKKDPEHQVDNLNIMVINMQKFFTKIESS
jgi:hypothetical protein